MSLLHQLTPTNTKAAKRIGRGFGSGKGGHTSTRGTKGQKARVGSKIPLWFEGGQLPLTKRLPMLRGKSRFNVLKPIVELTLADLDRLTLEPITLESLKLNKIIDRRAQKVKIIAQGTVTKKLSVVGLAVSAQARIAIEQAGGSVTE
ncbi:MAG TPA: 50S ribosomal protein L15 [Candidatus Pacebacteria bacterium]|nr:50S ribosomal protein L15 [Candidatus Paceibacterota bacterium]